MMGRPLTHHVTPTFVGFAALPRVWASLHKESSMA